MEIHRCRFVDYMPSSVNKMAISGDGKFLAVARANASIEIRSTNEMAFIEKVIPGGPGLSVEALVWGKNNRLFSAGHHALITEWNLVTLRPKIMADSFGGAVWSLAIDSEGTTLAVGCEDGCVRLFDIHEDAITYKKSLVGDKARILSVSWQPKSNYIVTGSAEGVIRRWNVVNGRPTHRMTVESQKGEKTLVWCVLALVNGTIVSGDSLGHVQFWDGEVGTLLEGFPSHSADVLAMAANQAGDVIFAGGVDNQLVQFCLLPENKKWIMGEKNRAHTHDIKALAMSPVSNLLVSGGIDTNLITYMITNFPRVHRETPPYPNRPIISVSRSEKMLCCLLTNKIEIWKLGESFVPDSMDDTPTLRRGNLSIMKREQKLLELIVKGMGNIVCCALSENGSLLALSDSYHFRFYHLAYQATKVVVQRISTREQIGIAHKISFTADSKKMLVATYNSYLQIFDVTKPSKFQLLKTFSLLDGSVIDPLRPGRSEIEPGTICSLIVSVDGRYAAVGDSKNRIHVFDTEKVEYHSTLPIFHAAHTTLSFHPTLPLLIVAYASFQFNIFDLTKKTLSLNFHTPIISPPPNFKKHPIMGIAFHPLKTHVILFYGLTYILQVDIEKKPKIEEYNSSKATTNPSPQEKRPKVDKEKDKKTKNQKGKGKGKIKEDIEEQDKDIAMVDDEYEDDDHNLNPDEDKAEKGEKKGVNKPLRAIYRYNPILLFENLGDNSFVVVEKPWLSITEKLPAPLYRPRYGT